MNGARPVANGWSDLVGDLAGHLEDKGMRHVRRARCHPQTQGKIELWPQTMKNRCESITACPGISNAWSAPGSV